LPEHWRGLEKSIVGKKKPGFYVLARSEDVQEETRFLHRALREISVKLPADHCIAR
jgi:hypothetical protein